MKALALKLLLLAATLAGCTRLEPRVVTVEGHAVELATAEGS